MALNPAERVRERMRLWMETTDLSQREFAQDLKKTQPWLDKVLLGENHVRLRDLDEIAQAMRTTAAELVRSEDDRYALELTPLEVRLITKLRRRADLFQAMIQLLDLAPSPAAAKVKK